MNFGLKYFLKIRNDQQGSKIPFLSNIPVLVVQSGPLNTCANKAN